MPDDQTSSLTLNIYDGTREPLANGVEILYRVFDGNQNSILQLEKPVSSLTGSVPFYNNLGDNYRVVVSADGYCQAGFTPVHLTPSDPGMLDLMLLPRKNKFDFTDASWTATQQRLPFLAAGVDGTAAQNRYEDLMKNRPFVLAALLNITTAMTQIFLPAGTPLTYIKQIIWDDSMAQDRFFAFCDPALMDQVKIAAKQGLFAPEFGSGFFHPGATASWKQVQFGEANVQLTFHENTKLMIDGLQCIELEPDIDYYKDLGAHTLFEVIPNKLSGGLSNPEIVYVLRWIAGRHAGVPEFNPPYTIQKA